MNEKATGCLFWFAYSLLCWGLLVGILIWIFG